jgi:hypothetical protein
LTKRFADRRAAPESLDIYISRVEALFQVALLTSAKEIFGTRQKRKISAGTRIEARRKARDTLMPLQKTCKKLGNSFYDYLRDRLSSAHQIADLTKLMKTQVRIIYKPLPDY